MGTILCSVKHSFFPIDGISQRNKSNFDKFIKGQQRFYCNYSHILSRDDEMSIKFRASQKQLCGLVK